MEKLTVTLITYNEEKNIERCLESVRWADEIVVLDSRSTDRTVDLCRKFTDRVYQESWQGYGPQKNLCAGRASHQWILNIDADEEITPEGAEEIRKVLEAGPAHRVYDFPRKNFFGRRWVRYGGWYPDRIARLYDRSRVCFSDSRVHERLIPEGDKGAMKEPILHHSFESMEDYIDRQNRYSTLFAQDKIQKGWQAGWTHLYLRPWGVFFKNFVLRQGFREGFLGVFLAWSMAFYTFLKYAKTRSVN